MNDECIYEFKVGPKKGTTCGRLCRDELCYRHKHKKCPHNKRKSICKQCGGGSLCSHNRIRTTCKQCGGGSLCIHNRIRSKCVDCGGGNICPHNKQRSICKKCKGGFICSHNKEKNRCKICDPRGHLSACVSTQIRSALKDEKTEHSIKYLGCTIEEFRNHIETQFHEGMTWDNYGEWHIDHIIPLKYNNPTLEEVIERLHWSNTQPLWASENIAKGNHYIG